MALGFTDFTTGQQLTADLMDGVLRQTVMYFASASARDSDLSGVVAEGMVCYLADAPKRLMYYDGTIWRYIQSEWTSYTPTWQNVTVGNGTSTGEYRYRGDDLEVNARFILGSSSSVSSNVMLAVPDGQTVTGIVALGTATFVDSSTKEWIGVARSIAADTSITFYHGSTGTGNVSATDPFTFGTGDEIRVSWKGRVN